MTSRLVGKIARRALWVSPVVIAVVGFFAVLHWLRPRNTTFVLVLSAVTSLFVMGYAVFLARRVSRHMDEVQIANQRYATFHGWTVGMGVTMLLLQLPPLTNRLIDLADFMTSRAPDPVIRHHTAVLLGLNFGFMVLVLAQTACIMIASWIWQRRMARAPEQA